MKLLPCPFCGSMPRKDKVWMDATFIICCVNAECSVMPAVHTKAVCKPNSGSTQTFTPLWEQAEKDCYEKWNTRF